jgi:hypothetical protein
VEGIARCFVTESVENCSDGGKYDGMPTTEEFKVV